MFAKDMHLYNSLMYMNNDQVYDKKYWLLYDGLNEHFHVITNIKNFLQAKHFCNKCFRSFKLKKTFDKHLNNGICNNELDEKFKTKTTSNTNIPKDVKHYLSGDYLKGSSKEINTKKSATAQDNIKHPRYIVFDFECDTSDDLHKPNHCEVDVLEVADNHDYKKSLIESKSFPGYDCVNEFCTWLFDTKNKDSTVFAHNSAGYDSKFILSWCLQHDFLPTKFIRQGSRITYMSFKKYNIRFVDTLNFFLAPLRELPNIFDIKECTKGDFPHKFHIKENQNYIGNIPDISFYGPENMKPEVFEEFIEWYDKQKDITNWNFKMEMQKYCRSDVEVLSRSILAFSKLFHKHLDVDPFRYVTLASLCMSIYINKFLPDKSIVCNDSNKPISKISRERLYYLNNKKFQ